MPYRSAFTSLSANVKIASTFKEAQLIERYGSGIKRIQQGFGIYGLKPRQLNDLINAN
jgi:Predicted transcriptional regulator containing an HTH domain and an uncharacterized domain shared with the mammalian protein Schlafen